ncbi:MAG TPA: hypothetical protein VG456_06680 [Candidatus Sulfopaludibacter sp.]|nr:hypothetical protein [Candidatus Sulfopaludibacter sp.]
MAKALGFKPKTLIRNRPDPKQKWKLPVKYWIHDLHRERFGHVIGEAPDTGPVEDVSYMEEDDFPAFSDDDVPF